MTPTTLQSYIGVFITLKKKPIEEKPTDTTNNHIVLREFLTAKIVLLMMDLFYYLLFKYIPTTKYLLFVTPFA